MKSLKALINARIYDYHEYHELAYIAYDELIEEVGKMSAFSPEKYDHVIDMQNNIVIPGFVAGHTHLYSAFARGLNVPFNPNNFKEILEQLWWKLDHFLDEKMIIQSAFSSGLEQMVLGSTTLIDHHASHLVLDTLEMIRKTLNQDLNLRAILAFETSDRFDVDQTIIENINFIEKNKNHQIAGMFGMHASMTLSDETLKKVRDQLNGAGIHIHVAESEMDELDAISKHGQSVVQRLDSFGLVNDKSLLVHCTHVKSEELDIIKKRNAYIAVNPSSNMNNAVGLPPLALMKEKKIPVIIGNDGLIPSMPLEYLNTYYSAHLKTADPVGFSLDDIREMIIDSHLFAGRLLDLPLGRIKKGYAADLIAFPYHEYTPMNENTAFSHLFFGAFPALKPQYVICGGKLMVEDYKIEKHLIDKNKESIEEASKLWERIQKEGAQLEFKD